MSRTICVDASAAAKWLLDEDDSSRALALLRDAVANHTRIVGPPHLVVEVTSAVYKRVRLGQLSAEDGQSQLERFSRIRIDLESPPTLIARAFKLAADLGQSFPYDAFYLALGLILDCDVWTADEVFFGAAGNRYPRLRLLKNYR